MQRRMTAAVMIALLAMLVIGAPNHPRIAVAQDAASVDPGVANEDAADQATLVMLPKPVPTKLEAFEQAEGTLVIKGYTRVGSISFDNNAEMTVYAVSMRNAARQRQAGIAIEIVQQNRGRAARTYIDEDELDGLVQNIEALAQVNKDASPLENVEASYRTRGNLQLINRDDNGGRLAVVRAVQYSPLTGQVVWATARLRATRLSEITRQLQAARDVLQRTRNAG